MLAPVMTADTVGKPVRKCLLCSRLEGTRPQCTVQCDVQVRVLLGCDMGLRLQQGSGWVRCRRKGQGGKARVHGLFAAHQTHWCWTTYLIVAVQLQHESRALMDSFAEIPGLDHGDAVLGATDHVGIQHSNAAPLPHVDRVIIAIVCVLAGQQMQGAAVQRRPLRLPLRCGVAQATPREPPHAALPVRVCPPRGRRCLHRRSCNTYCF